MNEFNLTGERANDHCVSFTLSRNPAGALVFTSHTGEVHEGVVPVRAFPIAAPDEGLSLVNKDGHELTWLAKLDDLPDDTRNLIEEELAQREFMPEIRRINRVSSFATPSTWQVETDRGTTDMVLKAEDHIRRLAQTTLLIADSQGIYFMIRDIDKLDSHSRKLLDRFL